MLTFIVQSDINNTELQFETKELEFLLDTIERQKRNCYNGDIEICESLYNKIKALCIFDKLPDKKSIEQIKDILLSSNNITKDNIHKVKIENLQFSKRTFNCLNRAGIKTLADLLCLSEDELLRIRNLGLQSLNEIVDFLNNHDLELPKFTNAKKKNKGLSH